MQNLHNAAPPGVPIDRRRMRQSASFVAPVGDDYVEPDSPRTAARKALDRKYPPLEYRSQAPLPLKPLSPRSRAAFEEKTRAIYNAQGGDDGEVVPSDLPNPVVITSDLRAKVREFKQSAVSDFKSMAMEIYNAQEDGMEQRAIRKLQATEARRPQQEFREKAFQAYNAGPSREQKAFSSNANAARFAHATDQLNRDDYLWQRQGDEQFPQFGKTQDQPLVKYRNRKMQRPSHVGNFHELTKMERKERNIRDDVNSKYQPSESNGEEGYDDGGGGDEWQPQPNVDGLVQRSPQELKARDSRLLKRCLRCCGCCSLVAVFFAPILGMLMIATGCDAETRSLDAAFDAINVQAISVLKDRGPVTIEILPDPTLPSVLNQTTARYGVSAMASGKIRVQAKHFARTQEALAAMRFSAKQTGGCRKLSDGEIDTLLTIFGTNTAMFGTDLYIKNLDELLKRPPRYSNSLHLLDHLTCDRERKQCVKCDSPLVLSVVSWWDAAFNTLYDCTRSEITIQIPRSIADGVAQDYRVWDAELEEYVYAGTRAARNEPSVAVEVRASSPSGWFLPLSGDIAFKGRHDVVLRDVNLTTNAGKISLKEIAAWAVRANATAGGVNATLVSTGNLSVAARADVVYGNLLPSRSVEVGEVKLENLDLELWDPANLYSEYSRAGQLNKGFKSRETGDTRLVYNGADAGASALGHLRVQSDLAPVTVDNAVHGNITVVMSGDRRASEGVDMTGLEGDIKLTLNAFEYQGTYDVATDAGNIDIHDEGCSAIVERESSGENDDTSEPSSKAGRIGNVRDMRTYEPMSRMVSIRANVKKFAESSIDLSVGCANYRRCELDCSWRGMCEPDSGTCTCDAENFYNHSTRHHGGGCQYTFCPNDCSGKGSCDSITGQCTCEPRWYDASNFYPCTYVHCDDGPHAGVMECGSCQLEWNGSTLTCAPVSFLTPSITVQMAVDDLLLNQFNRYILGNMTYALDLLNRSSMAGTEARGQIASSASAILDLHVPPSAVQYTCSVQTRFRCRGSEPNGNVYTPAIPVSMAKPAIPESCLPTVTAAQCSAVTLGTASAQLDCEAYGCRYRPDVANVLPEACLVPDCMSVTLGNFDSAINCGAILGCNYTWHEPAIIAAPARCSNFGDTSSRAACEQRPVSVIAGDAQQCTKTGNVFTPAVTELLAAVEACTAADGTGTETGTGACAAVILGFGEASKSDCEAIGGGGVCTHTPRVSAMDARAAADASCTNPTDADYRGDASSREACEHTGNVFFVTGFWLPQDVAEPLPAVADADLDVRCGAEVKLEIPVRLGLPDTRRIASEQGVRWGTPASKAGRRQLMSGGAGIMAPAEYLASAVVNNSLVLSLDLHFLCPHNCTGPSGVGGSCNSTTGECTCHQSRFRDDCWFATCPGDPLHATMPGIVECSGAGTCDYLLGRCTCIQGRAGDDCSLPDVPCPSNCFERDPSRGIYVAHGKCDRTIGVCTCIGAEAPGLPGTFFMGEDCSMARSPCGETCPGRSYCDSMLGECVCPAVRIRGRTFPQVLTYGYGCAMTPCLIPIAIDRGADWLSLVSNQTRETQCNQHITGGGVCNTHTGMCDCELGFTGFECETRQCVITNGRMCSGHGVCNHTSGMCICEPRYGDTVDCSRMLCPDSASPTGFGLTCGGGIHPHSYCDHGTNTPAIGRPAARDGTCKCEAGWVGNGALFCELRYCPGQTSFRQHSTVCGGAARGECSYQDGQLGNFTGGPYDGTPLPGGTCKCKEPYTGLTCQYMKCPGEAAGWDPTADGQRHRRNGVCSGQGLCNPQTGSCECDAGWSRGVDVVIVDYNVVQQEASGPAFVRQAADPDQPNGPRANPNFPWDVPGMAPQNEAVGFRGYYGGSTDAPYFNLLCNYKMCPNDCSGNGRCNYYNGTCECNSISPPGRRNRAPVLLPQPSCDMRVCPTGRNGLPCAGNGDCDFITGQCQCTALGVTGVACSERFCINDCWGQGTCNRNTGVCTCNYGWEGIDCGLRPDGWTG